MPDTDQSVAPETKPETQEQPPTFAFPPASADVAIPSWVKLPRDMKLPKHRQVFYIRFRAAMTDTPDAGERQCIVWSNNIGDQKLAIMRSDGDPNKLPEQLAKQMIRSVDGAIADWTGEPGVGNIDVWWDAIGPKCRSILDRLFVQLHVAKPDELVDFFENCVVVRHSGG